MKLLECVNIMKVVVYYNCPVPVTFLSNTFHLGRVLD